MRKYFLLFFLIILTTGVLPVKAATFLVGTPAELINAINNVVLGDIILFTEDITLTAVENVTNGNNGLPVVTTSSLLIDGNGFTLSRDLSAPDFRLFEVAPGVEIIIQNLTITGGSASGTDDGGAIYINDFSYVGMLNVTIIENHADGLGGAIYTDGDVSLDIYDSIVSNNSSSSGGALYHSFGSLRLIDTTVNGNEALTGGGVYFAGGRFSMAGSTISDNVADYGAGIISGGTFDMTNSTISGNIATDGGGIVNMGTSTINNSTIVLNQAVNGAGVRNAGTITLTNSIVSGNNGSSDCENIAGTSITNGNNILGHSGSSNGCPAGATDIIPAGALNSIINTTLADNGGLTQTHEIVFGSPAIDASGAGATTDDQRGVAATGIRDIGAFEANIFVPIVSYTVAPTNLIEGNTATVTVTLAQYGGTPVDVSVAFSGSSDAGDYSITGSTNLTFTGNGSQSFTITALDDGTPEAAETLILTLGSSMATITGANPQTISISDAGIVIVPPSTTVAVSNNSDSDPAPAIALFDPSISKIGFLVPRQVGVTGEQLQWSIIVSNTGNVAGNNVVITDVIDSRLQVNSVVAPGATVDIQGQQVRVIYPTLNPGETQQFSIFTTVLDGVEINNTACVDANNQGAVECATGTTIAELPQTGEAPFWRNHWLLLSILFSLIMLVFPVRKLSRS